MGNLQYADVKTNLTVNRMSRAIYKQLKGLGEIKDDQLYVITDEDLDANDQTIKNVAVPEISSDAANKQYVDAVKYTAEQAYSYGELLEDKIDSIVDPVIEFGIQDPITRTGANIRGGIINKPAEFYHNAPIKKISVFGTLDANTADRTPVYLQVNSISEDGTVRRKLAVSKESHLIIEPGKEYVYTFGNLQIPSGFGIELQFKTTNVSLTTDYETVYVKACFSDWPDDSAQMMMGRGVWQNGMMSIKLEYASFVSNDELDEKIEAITGDVTALSNAIKADVKNLSDNYYTKTQTNGLSTTFRSGLAATSSLTAYETKMDHAADVEMLSAELSGKIVIDDKYAKTLELKHVSRDEYSEILKNGALSNCVYVVSSETINAYDERITNVGDPEEDGDAVNLKYVKTVSGSVPTKVSQLLNDSKFLTNSNLTFSYNSTTKKITLSGYDNAKIGEVDCADFIKDGMLSTATLVGNTLVFRFNTSGPSTPISVDLSKFVDNYDDRISELSAKNIQPFIDPDYLPLHGWDGAINIDSYRFVKTSTGWDLVDARNNVISRFSEDGVVTEQSHYLCYGDRGNSSIVGRKILIFDRHSVYETRTPNPISFGYNLVINSFGKQFHTDAAFIDIDTDGTQWQGYTVKMLYPSGGFPSHGAREYAMGYLQHMTGSAYLPKYGEGATEFIYLTKDNTIWKYQYDDSANRLYAFRVDNFPLARQNQLDALQLSVSGCVAALNRDYYTKTQVNDLSATFRSGLATTESLTAYQPVGNYLTSFTTALLGRQYDLSQNGMFTQLVVDIGTALGAIITNAPTGINVESNMIDGENAKFGMLV